MSKYINLLRILQLDICSKEKQTLINQLFESGFNLKDLAVFGEYVSWNDVEYKLPYGILDLRKLQIPADTSGTVNIYLDYNVPCLLPSFKHLINVERIDIPEGSYGPISMPHTAIHLHMRYDYNGCGYVWLKDMPKKFIFPKVAYGDMHPSLYTTLVENGIDIPEHVDVGVIPDTTEWSTLNNKVEFCRTKFAPSDLDIHKLDAKNATVALPSLKNIDSDMSGFCSDSTIIGHVILPDNAEPVNLDNAFRNCKFDNATFIFPKAGILNTSNLNLDIRALALQVGVRLVTR